MNINEQPFQRQPIASYDSPDKFHLNDVLTQNCSCFFRPTFYEKNRRNGKPGKPEQLSIEKKNGLNVIFGICLDQLNAPQCVSPGDVFRFVFFLLSHPYDKRRHALRRSRLFSDGFPHNRHILFIIMIYCKRNEWRCRFVR